MNPDFLQFLDMILKMDDRQRGDPDYRGRWEWVVRMANETMKRVGASSITPKPLRVDFTYNVEMLRGPEEDYFID